MKRIEAEFLIEFSSSDTLLTMLDFFQPREKTVWWN
jgi:hypothetical protein